MSLKRLQKAKRFVAQYQKVDTRESAKDREFEQYLKSLSLEELKTLYENDLEDYRKSPEGIALDKKYAAMTVEELTQEYFSKLKAN